MKHPEAFPRHEGCLRATLAPCHPWLACWLHFVLSQHIIKIPRAQILSQPARPEHQAVELGLPWGSPPAAQTDLSVHITAGGQGRAVGEEGKRCPSRRGELQRLGGGRDFHEGFLPAKAQKYEINRVLFSAKGSHSFAVTEP